MNYLDLFISGFRTGYVIETVLVTLVDDLHWELERGSVSLLVLLDLSAAFNIFSHDILQGQILWEYLSVMGVGGSVR